MKKQLVHGKNGTYVNKKCRCVPCGQAHKEYMRKNRNNIPDKLDGDASWMPGSLITY